VLLPGDPGRALLLAQTLLEKPIMFNHHRGLWGYTGNAPDGEPLTVQSTGMGGPSAAIVISELADLGARVLIRVGTCGGLRSQLNLGDLVVGTRALPFDGTGTVLRAGGSALEPDPGLVEAVLAANGQVRPGPVASTDLFYETPDEEFQRWLDAGALAVEMETATLYALSSRRGLRAVSLLLVTDLLVPTRTRIADEALADHERRLGDVALRALLG
jgi:DeoD family purine-nucleoside phosphorylase